jgi:hypothetical protein
MGIKEEETKGKVMEERKGMVKVQREGSEKSEEVEINVRGTSGDVGVIRKLQGEKKPNTAWGEKIAEKILRRRSKSEPWCGKYGGVAGDVGDKEKKSRWRMFVSCPSRTGMGIIMVREKVRWQKEGKRQEIRVTGGHKSTKVGLCVIREVKFYENSEGRRTD